MVGYLFAILALVCSFPTMLVHGMLYDVVLPEHRAAAHLAVVLADRQRELGVVKDGAVEAVVERVSKSEVASAAV